MILVWTILIGAASYRIWRLLALDDVLEPPRAWVLDRLPIWVTDLTVCPWCLGSWIAFGATWVTDVAVGLRVPVLVALAAAVVVGWLGEQLG